MKDKIEQFILNWGKPALPATHESFKTELNSLLKEVAEKAFNVGYDQIEYPAETAFKDYWKDVTNKPQP